MNKIHYIKNSLLYFRKQHFTVFLATLLSAAVLTGALIVGDSVKLSLQKKVADRLGKTAFALVTGDRFVRAELAYEISIDKDVQTASVLFLQGISINPDAQLRLNKTQVLGVDKHFWKLANGEGFELNSNEVFISEEVARQLKLQIGQTLLLRIQNADIIPLNAPFTSDEDPSKALRLKIKEIASKEQLGGFSLRNQQATTYNIFIDRDFLASKMELADLCNLILVEEKENVDEAILQKSLQSKWILEDAALELRKLQNSQQIELLSKRIFIDHSISEKVSEIPIDQDDILTYFVNSLDSKYHSTPHSFVTAASETFAGQALSDSEIIINSWLAEDLQVNKGDSIRLKYFVIGALRTLEEKESHFVIKDILPMNSTQFQPDLMPDFPGLSTAGSCSEWDAGIPIDLKKIRDKDEKYWDDFRGSPKALISLKKGEELWQNLFGNYTSIRFENSEISEAKLEQLILGKLNPEDIGLSFRNVRSQGQQAASNGVDFGQLFLSLSFFVIAAAILLMVLMYRLNLESRKHELGVLFALGYSRKQIQKLRLLESLPTVILGSVFGGIFGILYNQWMIFALNGVWNQAVHADMLQVFILPKTILIGVIISILISVLSIYLVIRGILKKSVISVIREQDETLSIKGNRYDIWIAVISLFSAFGLLTFSLSQSIAQNSSLMLMAGFLLLTGLTSLFSFFLRIVGNGKDAGNLNLWKLAFINSRRNKNRSIAVIALLAIGTFTIMVTGANRKTFNGSENQRSSGTGGYQFWAETTVPILQNINTEEGKQALGLLDEKALQQTSFVQFHSLTGDDASCLNLNQVQQPQILGIDAVLFDSLQAFSFAKSLEETNHPWLDLEKKTNDQIIPAIADQTVIQWGLIKKIGDTLNYLDEAGKPLQLVLVGGLNGSIFQGNILISEEAFMQHFPSAAGSKYMLIQTSPKNSEAVKQILTNRLSDYGIEIISASARLAAFYSVTNTYLSIFMILGGLGVIIGTIGLGIILMRNMLERRKEFELLKALGYQKSRIFQLILAENISLLILGMTIGIVSAFIGILPSILSPSFYIPSNFLFVLVLAVFLSALFWIWVSAWQFLRKKS